MKPVTNHLLEEVIHLPESEPISKDDDEAIRYMSQWDYGEYVLPPLSLSDLYGWDGRIVMKGEYVLFRSRVGDTVLYRKGPVCHTYDLRQIDAWRDDDGGWTWNESWHLRNVDVGEGNEEGYLLELVSPSACRHTIDRDGNGLYELLEVESGRPLFALLPISESEANE